MSRKIVVEPARLKDASSAINTLSDQYKSIYDNLFVKVGEMGAAWQGPDNQAFVQQIEQFRNDFENMKKLMDDYSTFLKTSAEHYEKTQDEVISAAKRLSTGK